MKVNNAGYAQYIEKIYNNNKKSPGKASEGETSSKDRIEISSVSKEIKSYFDQTKDSVYDTENVKNIKNAIQSGTYKVSSEELAEQIIKKIKEQS